MASLIKMPKTQDFLTFGSFNCRGLNKNKQDFIKSLSKDGFFTNSRTLAVGGAA
jgi:hypothetical protein